jgi:hypothetical protein
MELVAKWAGAIQLDRCIQIFSTIGMHANAMVVYHAVSIGFKRFSGLRTRE